MEPKPTKFTKRTTDGESPRPSPVVPKSIAPQTKAFIQRTQETEANETSEPVTPKATTFVPKEKTQAPHTESAAKTVPAPQIKTYSKANHAAVGFGIKDVVLDDLVSQARLKDEERAGSPRFRPRLHTLLQTPRPQWMSWGSENMKLVNHINDENLRVSNTFRQLQAIKLSDECQAASCRPPSVVDRLMKNDHAGFYRARLEAVRGQLQTILGETSDLHEKLESVIETITIDTLVVEIGATVIHDAVERTIAQNQQRTLLGSLQLGISLNLALENLEATIVQTTASIDRLLLEVIPQWTLSQALSYR